LTTTRDEISTPQSDPAPAAIRQRPQSSRHPQTGYKARRARASLIRAILIVVVCLTCAFPLVWMLISAFKSKLDVADPAKVLLFSPTWENFGNVLSGGSFLPAFGNSLVTAVGSTALALVIGLPAAYAIARFGLKRVGVILLLVRMLPGICYLVPWYMIFTQVGLVGGFIPLIISHLLIALPMVVWIMIGFFESSSVELEEAAQVDGLTRLGAFIHIVIPLARGGIVTAGLLAFIFSWNQLLFSLILGGSRTKTLPVALFDFISYASIDWGGLMAAATLMTLPIILISIFVQKHVVAGLSAGATKG
jgi:multiple sugar transport system permease protein